MENKVKRIGYLPRKRVLEIYIFGELKNPLLYKNIMMPIIGPIPNTKSTNFAEFFVCPNF